LGVETVSVILSEYGPDLSRFPTEKQFVAHMRLAPYTDQRRQTGQESEETRECERPSGGRPADGRVSIRRSQTALGAYYRRIAQRLGADVAVFATARKLAPYVYRLLRWGQPYVDEGAAAYEKRYQEARAKRLATTAKHLGYTLVPLNA